MIHGNLLIRDVLREDGNSYIFIVRLEIQLLIFPGDFGSISSIVLPFSKLCSLYAPEIQCHKGFYLKPKAAINNTEISFYAFNLWQSVNHFEAEKITGTMKFAKSRELYEATHLSKVCSINFEYLISTSVPRATLTRYSVEH